MRYQSLIDRLGICLQIYGILYETMDCNMSNIGQRMAQVRAATGLNQLDYAELINVAKSSYKNYERGALDM
jgi:ribosome-binding protein aMBF1 (putative translation factor)